MLRSPDDFHRINPYTQWIYDHEANLLPEPTPGELARRRAAVPLPDDGRLHVELGCGSGNFLIQMAHAHPRDHFVGFELRFKRLVKSARKLEREGIRNVWLLRERAENFADYFAPNSVHRVYIHFPDPWPKRAHWKKRMVSAAFLDDLHRILAPDGLFHLKTDHSGYFLHVLSLLRTRRDWKIHGFSNDLRHWYSVANGSYPAVRTEFEQMFLSRRKPIYYLALRKRTDDTERAF